MGYETESLGWQAGCSKTHCLAKEGLELLNFPTLPSIAEIPDITMPLHPAGNQTQLYAFQVDTVAKRAPFSAPRVDSRDRTICHVSIR